MNRKIYYVIPVLVALFLIFSITVVGAYDSRLPAELKEFNYERVIARNLDNEDMEMFRNMGCLIKNVMKDSASFDCPEDFLNSLPVASARKARVFYITDLNADQQTGVDMVWADGITGSGVNVAILDTGIEMDHPELQDSYLGGYDFVNDDPIPEDEHGHGTHVAGIITSNGVDADSKGVAPDAGIYMYKVCNANGQCYEDDMMAAMEAAAQTDAKIMSISIGGGLFTGENCDSDELAAKVNWAVDQGLTVTVSAGNDGRAVSSPGCASGAIGVGAVDSANNVPYWSGRGDALDILAPGNSIYSTLIDGYGYMTGTSMSAPHVAGVVALLLESDTALTTSEIKTALYSTANPANKCYACRWYFWGRCYGLTEVSCTPYMTGAGIVDAYQAYLSVSGTEPPEPDTDGDGLPDTEDECPSTYGAYCNGCPDPGCGGCQSSYCPAEGQPYCADDDSFCTAANADGTCSSGECQYQCHAGYKNCNGNWIDGCETDVKNDNSNCGDCGFTCGNVSCPDNGCGAGGCGEDEYGTYSPVQQASCVDGVCTGDCEATCQYDPACDLDDDDDGVPDAEDACPQTYGTECNGCPDPGCGGCAVMNCPETGAPFCQPGYCPDTTCPGNGCGAGTCESNQYGTYTTAVNDCVLDGNSGTCTQNSCTLDCVYDPACEGGQGNLCWSGSNEYLIRSSTQFKKFCKCAEGEYGYSSYSYAWGKQIAYQYINSASNEEWETKSTIYYFPAYRIMCPDGNWYNLNQDYYYG